MADQPERVVALSPIRLATLSVILGMAALALFILLRLIAPAEWEFGLEVVTEVGALELQPGAETRWRIDGAVICSREALALPDRFRLADSRAACGSRTWQGWQIDAAEQVVIIRGGVTAVLEATGAGLAISLRADSADSVGTLSVVGLFDGVALGRGVNLLWSADDLEDMNFPFSGSTTLGRAVSWSDPRMLQEGSVAVYTADESADRRTLVDEAELMLGDQVRLHSVSESVWPKGFIRISGNDEPMKVVAFGRADSLSIERYGDSGYDFRPDFLARLLSDPAIAFWGSLFIGYMSLVFGLIPFLEGENVPREALPMRMRYLRWLFRYRQP